MSEGSVRSVNRVPLEYWRLRGYTSSDVDRICSQLDHSHAARVQILPGLKFQFTVSSKVGETHQGHFPAIVNVMKEVLESWEGPEPVGDLFFSLEDGQSGDYWGKQAPVIAYAKTKFDHYTFLMPDPAYLGSKGYAAEREEIFEVEKSLSWGKKRPAIFWRGVNSGMLSRGPNWRMAPRVQLVEKSITAHDPNVIDAYFSHVIPIGNTDSHEALPREGYVREKVPFIHFLQYRYLVDVDGESAAWKSLFLKLQSKSVVLKVDSINMQWYYPQLVPWVHYVPIAGDVSDLFEIREFLEREPAKAQLIAERASALMSQIRIEQERADLCWLIKEILSCYRPAA